ncbi:hypothetical protein CHS0354_020435 [Potamilus streckersoni]|uniref:Lipase domain-containing protein n=1 Tax=Potamilus streckersoni TaxID=2493646 RepID=A0AAE0VXI2_9BIVA|nr:hypothetical protein CHS0354_020435 [Potamilus streckersoni]
MTNAFNLIKGKIFSFIRGSYNICYNHIGCFERKKPYDNALHYLPQSPSKIGLKYKLFTRQNPEKPELLEANMNAVLKSNFNKTLRTKFIIHGYQHSYTALWDIKMKDEILKRAS